MKTSETPHEIWLSIVTCLQAAHRANIIQSLRTRMNPHHPQEDQDKEIVDAERYSSVNWFLAKHVYFQNKEAMDKLFHIKHDDHPTDHEVAVFKAMIKVCEAEVAKQFEQQILKENDMGRNNYDEPELDEVEELDEDEQYAKETEGKWDGDEYVSDEESDEEEEFDNDEE